MACISGLLSCDAQNSSSVPEPLHKAAGMKQVLTLVEVWSFKVESVVVVNVYHKFYSQWNYLECSL